MARSWLPVQVLWRRRMAWFDDMEGDDDASVFNETTNDAMEDYVQEEEAHEYDSLASLLLNITIIGCLIMAYYVKKFKIYFLPESAGALIVGMFLGGIARLSTDNLVLFEFVSDSVIQGKVYNVSDSTTPAALCFDSLPKSSFLFCYHQSFLRRGIRSIGIHSLITLEQLPCMRWWGLSSVHSSWEDSHFMLLVWG